jgi:hypothetical protein
MAWIGGIIALIAALAFWYVFGLMWDEWEDIDRLWEERE